MSNSPLATYRRITKNKNSPRNHKIDTVTIHCMAGRMTGKGCADYFATTDRQVSANYCIGYDGDVAVSVDEGDRRWCSCSPSNDHRAVTVEVATESYAPYKCTDKAYNALLDLVTDVCRRNGIERLRYTGDTSGNMTKHKWFANTACPGAYLEGKFPDIQREVNRRLAADAEAEEKPPAGTEAPAAENRLYYVQIGAYAVKENAQAQAKKAKAAGFSSIIKTAALPQRTVYRVQIGAFRRRENAEACAAAAKEKGFEAAIL